MKHRAGSSTATVRHGRSRDDAPTVELRLPEPTTARGRTRARGALGSAFALAAAGLVAAVATSGPAAGDAVPALAPVAPVAEQVSAPPPVAAPTVPIDAAGDVDLGESTGSSDGSAVPDDVVGLTTDEAMDRYSEAGFDNVRFMNVAGNTVLVPNDLFRVVSAPAGEVADPEVSLVVWATEIPVVVTPEEQAASDRAEEQWERRERAHSECGLYRLDGIWSDDVADCIERRTS